MDKEVHFGDSLACGEKLLGCFGVTGYPRMKVNALLVLQRIRDGSLDKLLAQKGHFIKL